MKMKNILFTLLFVFINVEITYSTPFEKLDTDFLNKKQSTKHLKEDKNKKKSLPLFNEKVEGFLEIN